MTGVIGEGDNERGRSDLGLALPLAPLTARIPPAEARGIPGGPAAREDAGVFAAGTREGDPFAGLRGSRPLHHRCRREPLAAPGSRTPL